MAHLVDIDFAVVTRVDTVERHDKLEVALQVDEQQAELLATSHEGGVGAAVCILGRMERASDCWGEE